MLRKLLSLLLFVLLAAQCQTASSQQSAAPADSYHPTFGPARVPLGNNDGQLKLAKGLIFLNKAEAERMLRESGDPDTKGTVGIVTEDGGAAEWMAILSYNDCGYIKDDEADQLNADDLLEVIKRNTEKSNEERSRMGTPGMDVVGWHQPPSYNRANHALTWSIIGREQGSAAQVVNHTAIMLGRYGIMTSTVVGDLKDAAIIQPKLAQITSNLMFTQGRDYTAFRAGDRISDITMTGLITGGAAAAAYGAAKGGLLGKIGVLLLALKKGIIVVIAAAIGAVKWLFGKLTGRGASDSSSAA